MITWALTGSKSLQINVDDSEKVHISVMCSITLDFEKLPLFFIAKGKTERSEHSQLGDIGQENEATHSAKSFKTTQCFIKYLEFLRSRYPLQKTIHLIVDSYSSHHSLLPFKKLKN